MLYTDPMLQNQSSKESAGKEITDFISDNAQIHIDIYLISGAPMFLGIFGMASNIINFGVLAKQGFKDCVSVCLLSLTFSDFFIAVFILIGSVCYSMNISGTKFYVDPLALSSVFSWTWGMLFDISMLTTTFISVERCISVLFPFKFKNLITFNRALICLFLIYSLTVAGYLALFMSQGLSVQFDPKDNLTKVMIWVSKNRAEVEKYSNILLHVFYGTLCEIVVILSTYGLIFGLRKSNKFRSKSTDSSNVDVLSQRNKNIVKMVTVLTGIFIVCNVIRLLFNYARLTVPEITFGKRFHNTFNTLLRIMMLSDTVGASLNIIVYYFFKPSFKRCLLSFLRTPASTEDSNKN